MMANIPELKKQFDLSLYDDSVLISTPANSSAGFDAPFDVEKIDLRIGTSRGELWVSTNNHNAFNYYECCGVLILFGIEPPSYQELVAKLNIL